MPYYNAYKQFDFYYVNSPQFNSAVDLLQSNTLASTPGFLRRRNQTGQSLSPVHIYPPNLTIIQPTSAPTNHPFKVLEASSGSSPMISVVAGSLTDLTNASTVWATSGTNKIYLNDVTNGEVPFATAISGSTVRQPELVLNSAATCVYLQCTVDSSTGYITAVEVEGDTGSGVPSSTSTQFCILLSTIVITTDGSGNKHVHVNDDGAQSNLYFRCCETPPLSDGSGYTLGT
jgi:hypothetical protein